MNALQTLESFGQSPWLDFLKRSLIEKGDLQRLIDHDGLKGLTSNPSIFEKAIGESDEYAGAVKAFLSDGDQSASAIYEHLAIADIRAAADTLWSVYDKTGGRDGYVSLECSPYLADDTEATIAEALRLRDAVGRPNLMVKVPATRAGIPAIRALIGRGLNINVTLLFSVTVYEDVVEAYISGLEALKQSGGDLSKIASVASFFVSRIDSAIDKKLDQLKDPQTADVLRGKAAIANAKVAYDRYKFLFSGPRWEKLSSAGAKTQRLLWASTSTKNPAYRDTLYVEALIGRDTVDTLPPATLDAFRDHGKPAADAVEQDVTGARALLAQLEQKGISLSAVTDELVVDGVKQFADAFDKLFGAIARRRREAQPGGSSLKLSFGTPEIESTFHAELESWRVRGGVRKLWAGDKSLWTGMDEGKWTGWLDIAEKELATVDCLKDFAREVREGNYSDVVLLGMGGSSLGPEVFAETFGRQQGWPRFHMLDSTDPAQIRALEAAVDLRRSLFIVSSKSGSTLEPNIFMAYFFDRVEKLCGQGKAGAQFVAVTDPNSSLEKEAKALNFAHIFHGVPSIGGRYSVLSKFGLVPAAAIGLDVAKLLDLTGALAHESGGDIPPSENSSVELGLLMGLSASRFRRDKVTIIASPGLSDFGAWLEQLLAESTGKQGRGLIPVDAEPVASADAYGSDRFFSYIALDGKTDPAQDRAIAALEKSGHPVARITVKDIDHIGQEFLRWELATAVAGAVIGIDPFDQPDVEASKVKTRVLTDQYEQSKSLPKDKPFFEEGAIALYADERNATELGQKDSLAAYLKRHFERAKPGDYVAILAYIERNKAHIDAFTAIRTRIRDKARNATSVGFGPRFQHSTGQAYKGGPNSGVFLQITCDDPADLPVPGHAYSFGIVKAAQAAGDLSVLQERDRRVLRIHLHDVEAGLSELARAVEKALA